jgi:hypothetical protein
MPVHLVRVAVLPALVAPLPTRAALVPVRPA